MNIRTPRVVGLIEVETTQLEGAPRESLAQTLARIVCASAELSESIEDAEDSAEDELTAALDLPHGAAPSGAYRVEHVAVNAAQLRADLHVLYHLVRSDALQRKLQR